MVSCGKLSLVKQIERDFRGLSGDCQRVGGHGIFHLDLLKKPPKVKNIFPKRPFRRAKIKKTP